MPIEIGDSTATVRSKINAVLTDAGLDPADNVDTTAATALLNQVASDWGVPVSFVDRMPEAEFRAGFVALESYNLPKLALGTPMAALGSSTFQLHNFSTSTGIFKAARGELNWVQGRYPRFRFQNIRDTSNSRAYSGDNFGISGNNADAILSRVTEVSDYKCVLLYSGSNDLPTDPAILASKVEDTIDALFSQGTEFILLRLVHPRGTTGTDGISDLNSPYWQNRIDFNNLLRAMSAPRVIVIDPTPYLVKTGSAIEEAAEGVLAEDGLHLSDRGGSLASQAYTGKMDRVFTAGTYLPSRESNLIPNGSMSVVSGGSAGAGITGTIPANFRVGRTLGTGTAVASVSDGLLQLVMDAGPATVRINASDTPATTQAGTAVSGLDGLWVQPSMRMKIVNGKENLRRFDFRCQTQTQQVGGGNFGSHDLRARTTNVGSQYFDAGGPEDFTLIFDPFLVPSGTTYAYFELVIDKAEGASTVQVGEFVFGVVESPI